MAEFGFHPENWKPIKKNTLLGSFSLRVLPFNLVIKECLFHEKNGKHWIAFPSRPWTNKSGETQYAAILDFDPKETWGQFQDAVIPRVRSLAGL